MGEQALPAGLLYTWCDYQSRASAPDSLAFANDETRQYWLPPVPATTLPICCGLSTVIFWR